MNISNAQYFQAKPHTDADEACCTELLDRVSAMFAFLQVEPLICPNTGTQISGSKGGAGDGGFRLQTATTGAAMSSHKLAQAVDVYDPQNSLDDMVTDEVLEQFNLYREAPDSTPHWLHLTTRAPHSGHRTFQP